MLPARKHIEHEMNVRLSEKPKKKKERMKINNIKNQLCTGCQFMFDYFSVLSPLQNQNFIQAAIQKKKQHHQVILHF